MTKYELYQILDENGFEPSEENLEILIEGLEEGHYIIDDHGILYEEGFWSKAANVATLGIANKVKQHNDAKAITKAASKRATGQEVSAKEAEKEQKAMARVQDRATDGNGKYVNAVAKKVNKKLDKVKGAAESFKSMQDKGAEVKAAAGAIKHNTETQTVDTGKVNKNGKPIMKKQTIDKGVAKIGEDYELYQLLDANGFAPTNENLDILKENLENGYTIILNADDLSLSESMSEDYLYMQILANNGFKTTYENVKVLKEALENGHVLLEATKTKKDVADEAADKTKAATLKDMNKKAITGLKIAGGVALGAMIGAGVGHGIKAAVGNEANKAADTAAKTATEASSAAKDAGKVADDAAKAASDANAAKEAVKAKEGVTPDEVEKATTDASNAQKTADDAKAASDEATKKAKEAEENATKAKGTAEYKNSKGEGAKAATIGAVTGGAAGGGIAAGVHHARHKSDESLDDEIKKIKSDAAK